MSLRKYGPFGRKPISLDELSDRYGLPHISVNPVISENDDAAPDLPPSLGGVDGAMPEPMIRPVSRPPVPDLAPAQLGQQPISPRVREARVRYEDAMRPRTTGQKIMDTISTVAPTAFGALFGGKEGAMIGAAAGGGFGRGEINMREANRNRFTDELNTLQGLEEKEYEADNQRREAARTRTQEFQIHQENLDNARYLYKPEVMDAIENGQMVKKQYDPDTRQWKTISQTGGKPLFKVETHTHTGMPVGITRVTGETVYDPKKMTPDEAQAFKQYSDAYDQGIQHQIDMQARGFAAAAGRQQAGFQHQEDMLGTKQASQFDTEAIQATSTRRQMEEEKLKGDKGDPQADWAMIAGHLGMTISGLKNARMTQGILREHIAARGLPEDFEVWFNKLRNGVPLSKAERQRMLDLAIQREADTWKKDDDYHQFMSIPNAPNRASVKNKPRQMKKVFNPKTRKVEESLSDE